MSWAAAVPAGRSHGPTARVARRRFFVGLAAVFLLIVLAGFAPSFYVRPYLLHPERLARYPDGLPAHLYLHGTLLTAWFVLAMVQTWLVATHRTSVHRRLGVAGVVLAAGIVAAGIQTTVLRDALIIDETPERAFGQLTILTWFSICIVSAVLCRRRPADHKRLMVFASLSLLAPALDRLGATVGFVTAWFSPSLGPAIGGAGLLSLFLVLLTHDLMTARRVHRATLWGLLAFVVGMGCAAALIGSGIWATFVRAVT